ncbi:ATP-binding cassette domain-containing protein [Mycolicibacterium goodii]|uniref:ABC transporter ATP-binding protein n=1 Tax=Mycolicibacterium goodii TaxID=134601 RepID=UPI001BDBD8A5|nr:ATP-binding cassette domain-containing protein [Mycolicibacterium goodii]MBU8815586.1 ATP-binding cassette domain-containing protein [Mycolicibacterium goodii]
MRTSGLVAENVWVAFGGRPVLRAVNLTVRAGDIVGVTGPSGCGKTTLLRVLAGLRRPDAGEVRYDDKPVAPAGSIGMIAQHPRLVCNPRWTLGAIVTEPARIGGTSADIESTSARVGLDTALLQRHPAQVSDGQLQRACIARALLAAPQFLLCDEPTAMLDPIAARDITDLLKQLAAEGTGIVLVSHNPRLVSELADCVSVLGVPPGN